MIINTKKVVSELVPYSVGILFSVYRMVLYLIQNQPHEIKMETNFSFLWSAVTLPVKNIISSTKLNNLILSMKK